MNGEKIVLIEDDQFLQKIYKDSLVGAGYIVLPARDGEEGIKVLKNNTDASLVLLDLILPGLNGIDVLKEIKKNPATKNLSVIVLSNMNEKNARDSALKLGASAYLEKENFSPQQIIETAKQYIDLRNYIKKQQ